jgi:hypothetical protein
VQLNRPKILPRDAELDAAVPVVAGEAGGAATAVPVVPRSPLQASEASFATALPPGPHAANEAEDEEAVEHDADVARWCEALKIYGMREPTPG